MTRAQQRDRTRATLVRVGRQLFAQRGYADVGLAEIVATAGVTKGALYHHFDGKTGLFRAVLEQTQNEVADAVVAAATGPDPWHRFTAGCRAFLTASTDPDLVRIMLIDGPAVLGWSEWRAMDEATSARHLADALRELMDAGVVPRQPLAPLTRLLSGAMNEAALWLAESTDPADLEDTWSALSRLLDALPVR